MSAPRRSRRRFDDDEPRFHHDWTPIRASGTATADDVPDEPSWSTYLHPDTLRGPSPVPHWVVTSEAAIDTDHGVLKTGKEADVALVERGVPDGPSSRMAVKRYRSAQHRMFHRDAGYLEGRRVRKSREMRAMTTRTDFGKQLIAGQWAVAEFAVLSRLWSRGAAVPYPVQLLGTELMMELIASRDGAVAPRLAQLRPDRDTAHDLYRQLVAVLRELADAGYTHGDLSAYNVLVADERLVLIDLPQAVDLVGNPQGFAFLRRDCDNICTWFAAHGVPDADGADLADELMRSVPGIT